MTQDARSVATHLADNLKQLREARGITQQQMAQLAGVPRPTLANLESGSANPTLAVLVKVAHALSVTVEEVIAPPRATAKHYRAAELPVRRRGQVLVRRLLPDVIAGLEMERMELSAGGRMTGTPHTPGTREYLTCESGRIELTASGTRYVLEPGDVVVFRGDQKHGYMNPGRSRAIAYTVVSLAPVVG
jgi:transcriptional regulator with XRE-family HTH domain